MATTNTFLERMQPVIDAMPAGDDKEKLLALVESQDTVERPLLQCSTMSALIKSCASPSNTASSGNRLGCHPDAAATAVRSRETANPQLPGTWRSWLLFNLRRSQSVFDAAAPLLSSSMCQSSPHDEAIRRIRSMKLR